MFSKCPSLTSTTLVGDGVGFGVVRPFQCLIAPMVTGAQAAGGGEGEEAAGGGQPRRKGGRRLEAAARDRRSGMLVWWWAGMLRWPECVVSRERHACPYPLAGAAAEGEDSKGAGGVGGATAGAARGGRGGEVVEIRAVELRDER